MKNDRKSNQQESVRSVGRPMGKKENANERRSFPRCFFAYSARCMQTRPTDQYKLYNGRSVGRRRRSEHLERPPPCPGFLFGNSFSFFSLRSRRLSLSLSISTFDKLVCVCERCAVCGARHSILQRQSVSGKSGRSRALPIGGARHRLPAFSFEYTREAVRQHALTSTASNRLHTVVVVIFN